MSLINDAIKKANTHTPKIPTTGDTHLHLEPVTPNRPARWPVFVVPVLLAAVVSLGVMFIMKGWQVSSPGQPLPVSAREVAPAPTPAPAASAPAVITTTPETTAPVTTPAPVIKTVVAPPPPVPTVPTFPELQLKGIIYRPSKPSAVINNKSLFIGERIHEAQVIGITADTVTVMWNEETRVLTMQ